MYAKNLEFYVSFLFFTPKHKKLFVSSNDISSSEPPLIMSVS